MKCKDDVKRVTVLVSWCFCPVTGNPNMHFLHSYLGLKNVVLILNSDSVPKHSKFEFQSVKAPYTSIVSFLTMQNPSVHFILINDSHGLIMQSHNRLCICKLCPANLCDAICVS